MDYPPRNTDSAEKIWIGKREYGFRAQRLIAADGSLPTGGVACCTGFLAGNEGT
jgi:hypothetical protein